LLQEAAVFEFLERPVIDQFIDFDIAGDRVLDFDQPLDSLERRSDHAFPSREKSLRRIDILTPLG
jgi:hypothetical protein